MKPKKGWMIATIVLAVLLVVAAAVIIWLAVDRQGLDDDKQAVETQLTETQAALEATQAELALTQDQLAQTQAELDQAKAIMGDAAAAINAQPVYSDMDMLQAVVEADLYLMDPERDWNTTGWAIEGEWATLNAGDPSDHNFQGFQMIYRKVSGQWTYVLLGTGLTPEDVPGAPAGFFQ